MTTDPPEIFGWIVVVLVLVLAGCVVAFLVTQRRKRAVLKRLAAVLGGRVAGKVLTVGSGSSAYEVSYFERAGRSRSRPVETGLRIRVNRPVARIFPHPGEHDRTD
jgi:hypothetical protein